ncbi:MAG: hypothetical protein ABI572_02155 [Actinomycetota bacterium]
MAHPHPHARDAGLRRISSITGWLAVTAVAAAAIVSVGVAWASDSSTQGTSSSTAGSSNTGTLRAHDVNDPWASTGGSGLQPPPNPPFQGIGGGQAVSGGS